MDMHESQESNFLVIHQSTMIGMIVVMMILGVISVTLYAFGVCWCRKIHSMCGDARQTHSEEAEMAEQGEVPSKRGPAVTLIK